MQPDTTPNSMLSRRAALALSGAVGLSGFAALARATAQPTVPLQDQPKNPPTGQPAGQPADRADAPRTTRNGVLVAFVMRHAETIGSSGGTSDPGISGAGRDRAARVGLMLRSVGIERVLHTATLRSQETAREIARVLRTGAATYDMFDPEPVTDRMIERGGAWLLIGHSNTVPDLVRRLGGDPGLDLLPDTVYDQIFMVVRTDVGTMTVPLHAC